MCSVSLRRCVLRVFGLSIAKCRFGLRQVAYLGRVTDGVRVWADPARMQGLRDLA